MDFRDRDVVVTGGTGALGTAVVGDLLAAGATCHVPYRSRAEADRFPYRVSAHVKLIEAGDLADENAIAKIFDTVPHLWASIHLAGGFAFGALTETSADVIRQQIDINLMTCLLCCRAAVATISQGSEGGRIVNVAARPALEWRQGKNMVAYTAAKAGLAAATAARRRGRRSRHPGQRRRAFDHGYACQPCGDAESRLRKVAEGGRGRGHDPVPRVAGQQGHAWRRGPVYGRS
jgi:NAD(P)-dependent dehydrogenase (short-subunit alcohol dehydrogenase family)